MTAPAVAKQQALRWTLYGAVLQTAMVLAGHWIPSVRNGFAVGGVLISAAVAFLFGRISVVPKPQAAIGGAVVGGVCALVGIVISVALGDTQRPILLIGTASSALIGALTGAIGGGAPS